MLYKDQKIFVGSIVKNDGSDNPSPVQKQNSRFFFSGNNLQVAGGSAAMERLN
jgi:hypothetical protein